MTTFISKITASILTLSLTLIGSTSLASSCSSHSAINKAKTSQPKASAQQQKKPTPFMFVIDAKKGEITKDKNGKYHLILKKVDMNQVILFSDRPQRIVKYITGNDLQTLWKDGKNSFEKDPPNAVLSGERIKTQIVVLNGIHITKESVRFPISLSAQEVVHTPPGAQQLDKHITLTIDNNIFGCGALHFIDLCCNVPLRNGGLFGTISCSWRL